ncbi:hypothetical protein PCL_07896 [Purpureocillium lilacinum]|uniref:Uncharacterized protein n=1 Tax=Purpureocillium lilacinum TaxID=33203 RepID=A0A2U3EJC1_PURLI|nr:hypothetical protein Purlil1_4244 [Purpureocillium lilacinum]PWI74582.1 hypothetical protein PCL_07896 [Purpureocillium lilacinum]
MRSTIFDLEQPPSAAWLAGWWRRATTSRPETHHTTNDARAEAIAGRSHHHHHHHHLAVGRGPSSTSLSRGSPSRAIFFSWRSNFYSATRYQNRLVRLVRVTSPPAPGEPE